MVSHRRPMAEDRKSVRPAGFRIHVRSGMVGQMGGPVRRLVSGEKYFVGFEF